MKVSRRELGLLDGKTEAAEAGCRVARQRSLIAGCVLRNNEADGPLRRCPLPGPCWRGSESRLFLTCPGGETGRRKGLKILFTAR